MIIKTNQCLLTCNEVFSFKIKETQALTLVVVFATFSLYPNMDKVKIIVFSKQITYIILF